MYKRLDLEDDACSFSFGGGESLQGRFEETLSHEFPATAESIPITRIGWNAGRMLYIQTIHTYPQEGLGVRSITFIHKERGA